VITASESDARALHERQGLSATPLVCRDLPAHPPPSPTPANLRQRLRLLDRPLILLHGQEPHVEDGVAIVQALAACPEVHLAALGADRWRYADTIALEAERLLCAGRLHLLREVPLKRFPAYAREADVSLCVPSRRPGVLLEAIYRSADAGLPVIVPPGSEGERVVGRFGFGWVAELADPEQLSGVLGLACRAERGTRRQAAARAGAVLNWAAESRCLIGLYQRLPVADERVLPFSPSTLRMAQESVPALARELRRRRSQGFGSIRGLLHYVLGRYLCSRGEYARAVPHFEAALRRASGDVAAAQQRAAALKDAGRSVDAIEAFRALLDAQGGRANGVAVNAAINLVRLGVRREPQELLDQLEATAKTISQLARAGELAAAVRDVTAARKLIERAVQIAPDDPALRKVEVRVLEQAGEPERALASALRGSNSAAIARLQGVMRIYDTSWLPTAPSGSLARSQRGRVLHLLETSLPHATTGYSYRTSTVLAAQRQAGLEPIVATRLGFPANRGIREFAPIEVVEGVVHHRFRLAGVNRYTAVPLDRQLEHNAELLGKLVQTTSPAVMHGTTPHYNGLLGLSLRGAFGIPMLYEARGFPEMTWAVRNGGEEASVYRLRRESETRCMLEADAVVTLSEVMKAHIVARGVPPERVWVVPHMVDVQAISPTAPSPALLHRYGLEGRRVIGYLGTLVDYEGIDLLLHALARLRTEHPSVSGLILGTGPAEPALRVLAKELALEREVIFAGRIPHDEVNEHVALFDVYVLPRHGHEVCRWVTPLKPYEAMAAGKCLLTSDVEALAETVTGGCGATFPAGDAESLAETLAELCRDPGRRAELGQRGREKIVTHHDRSGLGDVAAAPIRTVTRTGAWV
jgi:glycosyltransferase involved in cell wall biosynthesis/Flp pilus assembly protein TadD